MKKILITFAFLALGMSAKAQTFMVDGIRYSVVSSNTVKTDLNYDTGINDFDIPETVTYDGRTYSVSCIGSYLTSINSTSVKIPQTIQVIETRAFARTESLKEVYIANIGAWASIEFQGNDNNPLSNKNRTNISVYVGAEKTTDIVIPEGVGAIKKDAFYKCYWMSSIKLPKSLTVIQDNAFYRCLGLTEITIPENVNTIHDYAFYDCEGLQSITVNFKTPIELDGGHQFDNDTYQRATLYVPQGTKGAFQSAPGWSNFATIKEIESTGINSVVVNKRHNGKAYTLGGVETTPTAKGIVIQDGKKHVNR